VGASLKQGHSVADGPTQQFEELAESQQQLSVSVAQSTHSVAQPQVIVANTGCNETEMATSNTAIKRMGKLMRPII